LIVFKKSRLDLFWFTLDQRDYPKRPRWTGQRQGDLLRLPWSAYDGHRIRLQQSKTGARVSFKAGAPLKAMLDRTAKRSTQILVNSDGKPWTSDGFRASWRKAQTAAGIVGVTFNDLRGTALTRLALVGCTEAEIAAITGHTLRDVRSILDAHYLHRDPALADAAITKLETRTKIPVRLAIGSAISISFMVEL
jgi:integrase